MFGDGDSSNSRTPVHTYPGMGMYNLCLYISDSGCTSRYCRMVGFDSSGNMQAPFKPFSIKVITPGQSYSSVEDILYQGSLKLYPNPASFAIRLESTLRFEKVQVLDVQGKCIIDQGTGGMSADINIGNLSPGLYFMRVEYADHSVRQVKFIKN